MSNIDPNETCPAELPNFCAQRHWSIFWILILCSVTVVAGRAITVQKPGAKGDTPFFGANDRSRWCTIRALGDEGTYEIDEVTSRDQPIAWYTIDQVQHIGKDGNLHFYSSKPTLLPTMMAGVYKLVKLTTGKNLADDTTFVVRLMLLLVSVLPWAVYLFFMAKMINSIPVRDWSRYYVLACAGFGTFLSTFTNTLNNHLPAATSVIISLYFLSEIWRLETSNGNQEDVKPDQPSQVHWVRYFVCGLFAAFAAANELPALAFFAFAGLLCLIKSPGKTILGFAPAALLVAVGFFGTNYQAHQQFKMPYMHRGDGEVVASLTGDFESQLNLGELPDEIRAAASDRYEFKVPVVTKGAWPSSPADETRWVVRDKISANQMSVVRVAADEQDEDVGRDDDSQIEPNEDPNAGPIEDLDEDLAESGTDVWAASYEVRAWDNWYDYPGSYWLSENDENKSAVDRGQESVELYAFHVFFGHHGIFSLTPIWLLSLAGMIALLGGVKLAGRYQMRWLGFLGVAISIVVVAFYLRRPAMDRNYGGVTSALRWLFWLAPIWLVSMLPVVDWLASSKTGKLVCYVLLGLSAVSALYSMNNPWVHPWLYEIWEMTGLEK